MKPKIKAKKPTMKIPAVKTGDKTEKASKLFIFFYSLFCEKGQSFRTIK